VDISIQNATDLKTQNIALKSSVIISDHQVSGNKFFYGTISPISLFVNYINDDIMQVSIN
jgi:hypothetical protein